MFENRPGPLRCSSHLPGRSSAGRDDVSPRTSLPSAAHRCRTCAPQVTQGRALHTPPRPVHSGPGHPALSQGCGVSDACGEHSGDPGPPDRLRGPDHSQTPRSGGQNWSEDEGPRGSGRLVNALDRGAAARSETTEHATGYIRSHARAATRTERQARVLANPRMGGSAHARGVHADVPAHTDPQARVPRCTPTITRLQPPCLNQGDPPKSSSKELKEKPDEVGIRSARLNNSSVRE